MAAPITFIPRTDAKKDIWLGNFAQKLPAHATTLGLSNDVVKDVQDSAVFWSWLQKAVVPWRGYDQSWTAFRDGMRSGGDGATNQMPPVPTLDAMPSPVAPDIFGRLSKLVATIKNAPNYTEAIGKDLGIIAPEAEKPEEQTLKPTVKLAVVALGVLLKWSKQGNRRLNLYIEVDRHDGQGFRFLAIDTEPDYVDTLKPTGPAQWTYRAQYRLGDEPMGQWSDLATIAVAA